MKKIISAIAAVAILTGAVSGCSKIGEDIFPTCGTFYAEAKISGLFEYDAVITNEYIEIESSVFPQKVLCKDGLITCGEFTAEHTQTQNISVFNLPDILNGIFQGETEYEAYARGDTITASAVFKEEEYKITTDSKGLPQTMTWGGFTVVFSEFIFDKEADQWITREEHGQP